MQCGTRISFGINKVLSYLILCAVAIAKAFGDANMVKTFETVCPVTQRIFDIQNQVEGKFKQVIHYTAM